MNTNNIFDWDQFQLNSRLGLSSGLFLEMPRTLKWLIHRQAIFWLDNYVHTNYRFCFLFWNLPGPLGHVPCRLLSPVGWAFWDGGYNRTLRCSCFRNHFKFLSVQDLWVSFQWAESIHSLTKSSHAIPHHGARQSPRHLAVSPSTHPLSIHQPSGYPALLYAPTVQL